MLDGDWSSDVCSSDLELPVSDYRFDAIEALGAAAKGEDRFGYRAEFLKMVALVRSLKGE
jgi:hypothetical protein